MSLPLSRRALLGAAAASTVAPRVAHPQPAFAAPAPLVPIRARPDRIIDIAVCTRPFRAQGPRIEAQRIGRQLVVHNYGHGGSGWSLSWGSAREAVRLVLAAKPREIAVIGCGAIGLTSALVAQRAGLKVRIVARDLPPEVPSLSASGVWSPASRICAEEHADAAFRLRWEAMARHSFHRFQQLLGLADAPVEWRDGYVLSDQPFDQPMAPEPERTGEPEYPDLDDQLGDIRPRSVALPAAENPFPTVPHVRRYTQLTFNLAAYSRLLMSEFLRQGGRLEIRKFRHPREFARLKERVLIHATGYGARALLADDTLTPVRGQTARLIPQPGVDYGITWRGHNLSVVPRRDGILVQAQAAGDFGSADTAPDRAASEAAVERLASLFRR